ncbi:MAG: FHA domain-containing protein, partial [Planctomycetes bacterium]|nr:FHA domain-containing protein [Planctomycetota bacterium]
MVGMLTVQNTEPSAVHRLERDRVTVGRSSESDIRLEDKRVSKIHFVIEREGDRYRLRDGGSRNLTLINGRPVLDAVLREGDVIEVGGAVLV